MNIDSFVFPASNEADGNVLNSGIDLQFCVTADCQNKGCLRGTGFLIGKRKYAVLSG